MSDNNTIDLAASNALDEWRFDLPAFVRPIGSESQHEFAIENFHCWSPETTGIPSVDYRWGRSHAEAAIEFSRRVGTPVFLLFVVMAMRGRPIGTMERGFIDVMVSRALCGVVPSPVSDETMQQIAGLDVPAFRDTEQFMSAILTAANRRDIAEPLAGYVVELLDGVHGQWIGGGIFMLVGAAYNGSAH